MASENDGLRDSILDSCKTLKAFLADCPQAANSISYSHRIAEIERLAETDPQRARDLLCLLEAEWLNADDGKGGTILNAQRHKKLRLTLK